MPHDHSHGVIDPVTFSNRRGLWAIRWSWYGLLATAGLQLIVVWLSGSVALLADTLHNFGDAATAIPLWLAFRVAQRRPNARFTYGYGRVEDLAGLIIIVIILASAVLAGWATLERLWHPQPIRAVSLVIFASIIGCLGNEAVARLRIRVGREISSAALVADGQHARADALTSLMVLIGAIGVMVGYPAADPLAGLVITVMILKIVWDSSKDVLARLLDGIDPAIVGEMRETTARVSGVRDVQEIRVRWIGHRLHGEINLAVAPELSVLRGHDIADAVRHRVLHQLPYLSSVTIHVDPATKSGEDHHHIANHQHGSLPTHAH
jgi:cation diffusion facilitator family transporter